MMILILMVVTVAMLLMVAVAMIVQMMMVAVVNHHPTITNVIAIADCFLLLLTISWRQAVGNGTADSTPSFICIIILS